MQKPNLPICTVFLSFWKCYDYKLWSSLNVYNYSLDKYSPTQNILYEYCTYLKALCQHALGQLNWITVPQGDRVCLSANKSIRFIINCIL